MGTALMGLIWYFCISVFYAWGAAGMAIFSYNKSFTARRVLGMTLKECAVFWPVVLVVQLVYYLFYLPMAFFYWMVSTIDLNESIYLNKVGQEAIDKDVSQITGSKMRCGK